MGAGSSVVCNCDIPDSCICKIDITSNIEGAKTFTYVQSGNLPEIIGYDNTEEGEGAAIKIDILSKGCVGQNSECPSGIIYDEKGDVYHYIVGGGRYNLKYTEDDTKTEIRARYQIATLIYMALVGDINRMVTTYKFSAMECRGLPLKPIYENHIPGAPSIGSHIATSSNIKIYPNYQLELSLAIELMNGVQELTDDERRAIMVESNRSRNRANNGHEGWTKRTGGVSISSGLSIQGAAELTLGKLKIKSETPTLRKEFTRYKEDISFLNSAEKTLKTIQDMFTSSGKGDEYPILDFEFAYPAIEIKGGHELAFSEVTTLPYLQGSFSIGFSPLVGAKLKIDLLQAFAAYFGFNDAVEMLRTAAASGAEDVANGKNGAYAAAQLDLEVEGQIDCGFSIEFNEDFERTYKVLDNFEGKLSISATISLRLGAKIAFIKGFVEGGGAVIAEGCFGFINEDNQPLYLVFYHNGIQAEAWLEYGIGELPDYEGTSINHDDSRFVTSTSTTEITTDPDDEGVVGDQYKKVWDIALPVTKENSTWRISILDN